MTRSNHVFNCLSWSEDHNRVTCQECGDGINEDEVYYNVNDDPHCQGCYSSNYSVCNRCGQEVYLDDAVIMEDSGDRWCEHCALNYAHYCVNCGTYREEPCECISCDICGLLVDDLELHLSEDHPEELVDD